MFISWFKTLLMLITSIVTKPFLPLQPIMSILIINYWIPITFNSTELLNNQLLFTAFTNQ